VSGLLGGKAIVIGSTSFYGLRYHSSEAILAVARGVVRQVGIADQLVAGGRSHLSALLHSFRRGLL